MLAAIVLQPSPWEQCLCLPADVTVSAGPGLIAAGVLLRRAMVSLLPACPVPMGNTGSLEGMVTVGSQLLCSSAPQLAAPSLCWEGAVFN